MRTPLTLSLVIGCAAIIGCAKSETPADTTAATQAAATPPAPAPLQLSDVAGKWNMTSRGNTPGDTAVVNYVLTATPDTSGWSIKFANMAKPVPVHVVNVSGDSVTIEAGPYASVLRKGLQVNIRGVARLKDGKLVGTTVAHYKVKTADSLRTVTMEGTRAP